MRRHARKRPGAAIPPPFRRFDRFLLFSAVIFMAACGSGGGRDPLPIPPGSDATGTWTGELPVGSATRVFTIQLHRRRGGKVMGYVAGGTAYRTVTAGFMTGRELTLQVELRDPKLTRTIAVAGTISGNTFTGIADDGSGLRAIRWRRVNRALHERRFVFVRPPAGDSGPTGITQLAVVLDGAGDFVSGGFVGEQDCDLLACGGGLTSFTETRDGDGNEVIEIGLETGGDCMGSGVLRAAFDDGAKFYTGNFTLTDCAGTRTGDLVGLRSTRTRTDHVAGVLATYGRLADDLEARISFSAPYAPFSPDYSHKGETLNNRLDELDDQVMKYRAIDVDFSRFRNIHTIDEGDRSAWFFNPLFGVEFHDRRTGTPVDDIFPVVYRDVDTGSGRDELKYMAEEGGAWVIYGNRIVHDIPFAGYTLAADHVVVPTRGGDVYLSLGPWGAHSSPHTGHLEGNAKGDWIGQYAWTLDQLTELDGDNDGVCGPTDRVCGVSQADLEARIVDYAAPMDGLTVTQVRLDRLEAREEYYGSAEHWRVEAHVAHYGYSFDHIRDISAGLRDAMVAAGYTDPWTVHTPSGNLITGAPIVLNKGDTIARPQTVAVSLAPAGYLGYYRGTWGTPQTPSQQIEFFTYKHDARRAESFYTWLVPALENRLAGILEAQGRNPDAFRYNESSLNGVEAIWKAEMALSNQGWSRTDDYSSLFSALGGWWTSANAPCNENLGQCEKIFSIFPVRKDTVFYDPGRYHHPDVAYLVARRYRNDTELDWYGEVISPIAPDPGAGTLIIKWKDFNGTFAGYQAASYRLDSLDRLLRIAWGAIENTEGAVLPPPVPANTARCDVTNLSCYNHERNSGP